LTASGSGCPSCTVARADSVIRIDDVSDRSRLRNSHPGFYVAKGLAIRPPPQEPDRMPTPLPSGVESDVADLWMAGRFRPRSLTVNAEHCCHAVVPKRNDGALMLPARTGNVHVAVD
jgi:hypothetical protein